MLKLQTSIENRRSAFHVLFAPVTGITATNVQDAIEAVSAASAPSDAQYYVAAADGDLSAEVVVPAFMQTLLDDTTASEARTTLDVYSTGEADAAFQPLDAGLTSIAGLTTLADRMIYTTASDTYAVTALTAFGRSILDDADEATFKATVNLEIGTDVQAYSANLDSWSAEVPSDYALLADLASTANGDGAALIGIEDAGALITATTVEGALAENRTAIDAIEADYLTSSDIGSTVQAFDAGLTSIAGLTTVADRMIYTTASDTYAVTTLTSFARSILDDADEATFKATVNLEIGTDVQAFDADTLFADVGDTLTAGFLTDSYSGGTQSSGTYTPAPATGQENIQHIVNGGAFTLAPPASPCTVIVQIINNASAGTITTSGFDIVDGDSFDTTNTNAFMCFIAVTNDYSYLNVKAMQ